MKRRIAFFDTKPYDLRSFQAAEGYDRYEFAFFEARLSEKTAGLVDGFDGVCVFVNDRLNAAVIDRLLECGIKIIALRCAGFNNIDRDHLNKRIPVVRVPSYSPHAVAEHALALLLTLNRKTHKAYNRTRDGNFSIKGFTGFDLNGKTAGIIGTGKIGKIMISILKGIGMKILAYDYFPDEEYARAEGIAYVDLPELYAGSDVVSLHCPLTPETHHLIDSEAINRMKPNVILINTSRGGLIDTKALIGGLKKNRIGGAGLDVYEEEEKYFFEDHSEDNITDELLVRLLGFNNVLITSHQAFLTDDALWNISRTTLDNLTAFFDENRILNGV